MYVSLELTANGVRVAAIIPSYGRKVSTYNPKVRVQEKLLSHNRRDVSGSAWLDDAFCQLGTGNCPMLNTLSVLHLSWKNVYL